MKVEVESWAPVPNKPTVSVDVKQHSTSSALPSRYVIADVAAGMSGEVCYMGQMISGWMGEMISG